MKSHLLLPRAVSPLAAILFITALVAGCGGGKNGPGRLIDEQRGTFASVGIGDTPAQVKRTFGQHPAKRTGGITPLGHDFVEMGGPASVAVPCGSRRRRRRPFERPVRPWLPPDMRYQNVSFLVCHNRAYAVVVAEAGARTRKGVVIGDGLDKARLAYSGLTCGRAPGGEGLIGGQEYYPYCAGRIGRDRWIWFGEDPVASITVSRTRLGMPFG